MQEIRIDYSRRFVKDFKKAPRKVQEAFRSRLQLFLENKFHPLLRNHALKGQYQDFRSLNVTGDWRAIFREFDSGKRIYFDLIRTHSELYG